MTEIRQDVAYALRMARRAPKASAAAVLTVAIAVGATTAVISLLNAVVLRSLPSPRPAQLVMAYRLFPQGSPGRATYTDFEDWRRRSKSFQALAALTSTSADLLAGETPQRVSAYSVTSGFFSLLGQPPLVGRWFTGEDEQQGANPVAVLSEATWRGAFGSDPAVVGRRVRLVGDRRDARYEIVGVASSDIRLYQMARPAVFVAQRRGDPEQRGAVFQVVGRLRPGVTIAQATVDLTGLVRHGGPSSHIPSGGGRVVRLDEAEFGPGRPIANLLVASVGLVALIACLNIAALMLALGASRTQEFAVRAAAGASR